MISDIMNQTMQTFTYTQAPIVDPVMAYLAIGAIIVVIISLSYIAIRKPFRKKSKTKARQE